MNCRTGFLFPKASNWQWSAQHKNDHQYHNPRYHHCHRHLYHNRRPDLAEITLSSPQGEIPLGPSECLDTLSSQSPAGTNMLVVIIIIIVHITFTTTIIICSRVAKIANSKNHVIFKNFLRQSSSFPHSLPNVHQFDLQESVAIASGFWDLVLIISQMLQLIIITSKWNVRKSTLSGGGEWKTRGGQHQNMQMEWFELILESASTSPSSRQTPPSPSCPSPWPYSWPAWELAVKVVSLISAFQTFSQI